MSYRKFLLILLPIVFTGFRMFQKARGQFWCNAQDLLPGELDIIFADSGPGVSKGNKSAIFEPYFSTKPDGVGLGLVIAGEMIRDYYNGSLELLNSGPLPGAVFPN